MKLLISFIVLAALLLGWILRPVDPAPWTTAETEILESLWLDSLPPLPIDSTNRVADNPFAVALGQQLFFDTRLSANGQVSCATCHQPDRHFTDGLAKGQAIGTSARNTRSIVGSAYSPWLYWDGRRDSLWSQALSPLEDPQEHGGSRMQYVRFIAGDAQYRGAYETVFGPIPDFSDRARFPDAAGPVENAEWNANWQAMSAGDRESVNRVFASIGKAIAAYERRLQHGHTRFDAYVEAVIADDEELQAETFSNDEIGGLRLFIGKANCLQCHNGPRLTNDEFHNTGVSTGAGDVPDKGRAVGVREVLADPFNCLGDFSDDPRKACDELTYVRTGPELVGAVRTPSLRNLENTQPYMHKGQLETLADTLEHYNEAPPALIGHNEATPLGLNRRELGQLEAFLRTLAAPVATSLTQPLPLAIANSSVGLKESRDQ